jgi:hypothetical protein
MFGIEFVAIAGRHILEDEMDAGEQITLLLQTVIDGVPREFGVGENLRVWLKTNGGSVLFGITQNFERNFKGSAIMETDVIDFAFAVDRDLDPLRQGVRHRGADAVKTSARLIDLAIEFAARMEGGVNQLDGRNMGLRMDIDRDAPAFIFDLNRAVFLDGYGDFVPVAVHGFIDGVIDDFPHQMMEARQIGASNVHARAFPHALEFR